MDSVELINTALADRKIGEMCYSTVVFHRKNLHHGKIIVVGVHTCQHQLMKMSRLNSETILLLLLLMLQKKQMDYIWALIHQFLMRLKCFWDVIKNIKY